jgi:hypothetical protein
MRPKMIKIGAALVVLAALAGGGIAWATAANDDENVTGPAADRARAAALAYVGDGQVIGVERESESGGVWEVEVTRPDGSTVEVVLDGNYRVMTSGNEEDQDDSGENEDQ